MAFWNWLWGRNERYELGAAEPPPPPPSYGIENAIDLMRGLPVGDDAELVLRVVRKTLRSFGVSIEEIVASATKRETTLGATIAQDRAAIEHLEREIAVRKANIDKASAQLDETRQVRERLQDALQTETKVRPALSQEEIASLQAGAGHAVPGVEPKTASVPAPKIAGAEIVAAATLVRAAPPPLPKRSGPPAPRKSTAPGGPTSPPPGASASTAPPKSAGPAPSNLPASSPSGSERGATNENRSTPLPSLVDPAGEADSMSEFPVMEDEQANSKP
jgi:DNA-binding transcriptional MerR regulator